LFELRDYATGEQAGTMTTYLSDPGLVSYWRFDEAIGNWTGDNTARGNNGTYYGENSNNGSLVNGPAWVGGRYGGALQFSGTGAYVNAGNDSALSINSIFTVAAWFKTSKSGVYQTIINKDRTGSGYNQNYHLRVNNDDKLFGRSGNGSNSCDLTGTANVTDGAWHYGAYGWNGTHCLLYLDGAQAIAPAAWVYSPYTNTNPVEIGTWGGASSFNGTIDSVRIWNRTLNQSEIQAEMNSPRPVIRPIAAWEFDEGSGTVANDTHIWTQGKFNSGASFDGVDDYIQVNDSQNLRGMKNLTIYAWAKINSYNTYSGIIGKWFSGQATKQHYILGYFSSGKLWFWVGNDSLTTNVGSTQPSLNNWVSLTAVFTSGQDLKIYYNGTLQNTQSASIPDSIGTGIQDLLIGKYMDYPFNGTIDDVAIFNRSLTASEIAKIYNSGVALGDVPKVATPAYVNISFELAPGNTYTLNFSSLGNASNVTSIPRGVYLLRPSRYSQSVASLTDRIVTCA
jgi:hypothetical protein